MAVRTRRSPPASPAPSASDPTPPTSPRPWRCCGRAARLPRSRTPTRSRRGSMRGCATPGAPPPAASAARNSGRFLDHPGRGRGDAARPRDTTRGVTRMRAPEFWARDGCLPRLLAPGSMVTGWMTARRVAKPGWRAPVPVFCCGNASVGGSGKTTVALDLLQRLQPARSRLTRCCGAMAARERTAAG